VAPIIQTYPLILASDISVLVAIKMMSQARTHYVLVVEQEHLIGIFTQQDLVQKIAPELDLSAIPIANFMTHPTIVLQASEVNTPFVVLQQMQHYKVHHLPIVDEQDKLVGVISLESVLAALTEREPDDRTVGQKQLELPREVAAPEDPTTLPPSEKGACDWRTSPILHTHLVPNSITVTATESAIAMGNRLLSCPIEPPPIAASHGHPESCFQAIFEQAEIGITLIDPRSRRYLKANQQFCNLLGYAPVELRELSWQDLIPPNLHSSEIISQLNHALQTSQRWSGEALLQRKDGSSFQSLITISPVQNPQAELIGMMGIAIDITARKQAEAALQQATDSALQESLQSTAANRAKSEFLSRMSHELRTPLTSILGFAELVATDPNLSQSSHENLKIIRRSGKHLLSLINDVLDMSRIEAGQLILNETSINLYHLLKSLEELFRLKATSKGLALFFEQDSTVPQYIQADENKLRQIFINILGNALKFTQQGRITLRVKSRLTTELAESLQPDLSSNFTSDTVLNFEIEDTGSGIAPEDIERIFEAFVQTESGQNLQEGSTGLGLAISRQFVHLMGGKIAVRSHLGQGSLFSFYIPLKSPQEILMQAPLIAPPRIIGLAPNQPTYRILLVDDEFLSRKILICLLKPLGFEVREARSGAEAIALCATWHPHLIWMDMQMPKMTGYEATQQIRNMPFTNQCMELEAQNASHISHLPTSPIIIALTASTFDEQQKRAITAGCNDFLAKPFSTKAILEKLETHLGVRYRYAEPKDTSQSQTEETPMISFCSTTFLAAFVTMPTEWQTELQLAARRLSSTQCLRLIRQIPPTQRTLAQNLIELVENFQFDILLDLIRSKT
jgi:PAS domain S-box-containing protein